MFNIFNCCSKRINKNQSGNIIDKNNIEYNLSCFYFVNKKIVKIKDRFYYLLY